MRLIPLVVTCSLALGSAASLAGADVILKDGQAIATSKPYAVKGKMAILTRTDGSLVSIPVEDIDLEKTAAAASAKPAPPPEATPAPPKKPSTPAEAAKATSGKRATVVLTDADVRASVPGGPDGEKAAKGDGELTMGPTSETRTKTGYSFSGSVINSGKGDVSGVSVTIQVVGDEGKILQSTFGKLSKDTLAPGEKATFTSEVETETEGKRFRYFPSHQVTIPVKAAGPAAAGAKADEAAGRKAPPAPAEVNPAAGSLPKIEGKPAPEPTPQVVPRPDVAPPSASAPVGAPSAPGGAYLPRPADSQAGQTKTP